MRIRIPRLAAALFLAPAITFAPACAVWKEAFEESGEAVVAGLGAGGKTAVGVVALPIAGFGLAGAAVGGAVESAGRMASAVGGGATETGVAALDFAQEPLNLDAQTIGAPLSQPDAPYDLQQIP